MALGEGIGFAMNDSGGCTKTIEGTRAWTQPAGWDLMWDAQCAILGRKIDKATSLSLPRLLEGEDFAQAPRSSCVEKHGKTLSRADGWE